MAVALAVEPERWTDAYSDRIRPPALTVAALRRHFGDLGITRVADQTGLDRIGIPCFASFRPNSQTLATSQGKGLDRDAAMASAVMEAAELAVAEAADVTTVRASRDDLRRAGTATYDPERLLPFGTTLDDSRVIDWVFGSDLDGHEVAVPLDAVTVGADEPELQGIARSSNGLASGNDDAEAIFHGTCELVERDAVTLWTLRDPKAPATAIDPASFRDRAVAGLAARIVAAGFLLRLFDLTSDLGIPTVLAVIGGGAEDERRHFDLTAGYGCHPVAARAAIRAITEAAQSRVTLIAGARDDILPGDFKRALDATHAALLDAQPLGLAPRGLPLGTPLAGLWTHLRDRLREAGIDLVSVPLGGRRYGISVVRMLSGTLEDREPNHNWRPGPRALATILR